MRKLHILLSIIALSTFGLAQSAPGNDSFPTADGFYYKEPNGLARLQPISLSGGGAKHMGKMFVPGLTPQMVWTFRGAEAPVQITESRPIFYVRQNPAFANVAGYSPRDLLIIRFDKKKDHRELQATSGGNMFTFKAGTSKERTPDITVTQVSEGVFKIIPNADLPPAEYLLTFSALGASGYDFGIRHEKQ